jgi:hypothetical protein
MPIIATALVDEDEAGVLAHVEAIRFILEEDILEHKMAAKLRAYCREHLTDIDLGAEVHDRLSKYKIISKTNFRKLYEHSPACVEECICNRSDTEGHWRAI